MEAPLPPQGQAPGRAWNPGAVSKELGALNGARLALRALIDRWRAASQKQQIEKPERPTENVQ